MLFDAHWSFQIFIFVVSRDCGSKDVAFIPLIQGFGSAEAYLSYLGAAMAPRDVVPFYHYTSDDGLKGILKDGKIKISDGTRGDAVEGPGAYGTKYPPSTSTKTIARNNWDGGWKQAMEHGKMENYIRCEVPRKDLKECRGHGVHGRPDGILVHPHDIDLTKYATKIGKVGEHTVPKAFAYDPEAIRKAMYPDRSVQVKQPSQPGRFSPKMYSGNAAPSPYPQGNTTLSSCYSDDEPPQLDHSGHNSAGNYYEAFADGSYRYENQDGSTYEYDGSNQAVYTAPDGAVTEYSWADDAAGHCDVGSYGCGSDAGDHYDDGGNDAGSYGCGSDAGDHYDDGDCGCDDWDDDYDDCDDDWWSNTIKVKLLDFVSLRKFTGVHNFLAAAGWLLFSIPRLYLITNKGLGDGGRQSCA